MTAMSELTERVAAVEATTSQILDAVERLDQRVFEAQGTLGRHSGAGAAVTKLLILAAGVGAAVGASVSAIAAVAGIIGG